jgi:hypothetical protein
MINKKIFTILLGIIFLAGGVYAVNSLSNLEGITIPASISSGKIAQANFSYDYLNDAINQNNSETILQLNFTSENESFPVWKGDFKVSGFIERCTWTILGVCMNHQTINFNCNEEKNQTIIYPKGREDVLANNGTFYCYNSSKGNLILDQHDNVFLNIEPNIAIWPGQYNITAKMFYLSDTYAPFVNITNKFDFDRYYAPGNYLEVRTNITDYGGLSSYYGTVFDEDKEYSVHFWKQENELYYFTQDSIPTNLTEGEYNLTITAIDDSNNIGNDSVILKIDTTGPIIDLISPINNSVYDNMIPIEVNVTDLKAGANVDNVSYRIREVKEGFGLCPENGVGFGNVSCYNSYWVNLPYNSALGFNYDEFNSSLVPEGNYWMEVRAYDRLGNEEVLK